MQKKKLYFVSTLIAAGIILSCGGGGGGSSSSSNSNNTTTAITPSRDYQGQYTGAARQGDFAIYSVNGTTLTYRITGPIFGNINGTLTIQPMGSNNPSTHFWKSSDNRVYLFLAKNLGLAYVENVNTTNGQTTNVLVAGLREVGNVKSIIGKTFVYADITTAGFDGCEVTINNNNTFSYECLSGEEGSGCWKIDNNTNSLLAKEMDTTTCNSWDGSNPDYHIIAKATNGRAAFVLDHADGSGIGIGLEKRPYNLDTDIGNRTAYFETFDIEDECPAQVAVYKNSTTGQWEYSWSDCEVQEHGILNQNCFYNAAGNRISYNGTLCAYNENEGSYWNVMLDLNGGYYIAITNDGNYIEIGALKDIR